MKYYLVMMSRAYLPVYPWKKRSAFVNNDQKNDQTLSKRTEMSTDTITQLLRFFLMSTAFQYENEHYKQLGGIALGSPVSPVIADDSGLKRFYR